MAALPPIVDPTQEGHAGKIGWDHVLQTDFHFA